MIVLPACKTAVCALQNQYIWAKCLGMSPDVHCGDVLHLLVLPDLKVLCFNGILLSMPKYYTLQEANEMLTSIRPVMDEIQKIRQEIMDRRPEVWSVVEQSVGNGGSQSASKLVQEFERLDNLVRQVQGTGVLFKDLNLGLLDFPALKDGGEVYLCWKYGETDIAFWHEVEAGYAGRQLIDTF